MMLPHTQAQFFLLKWYESELTYIRDFQMWKGNRIPDWDYQESFRKVLTYFDVYRWIGPMRLLGLMTCTLDWVRGSKPDEVDEFAESLRQITGKSETSIASKILFLNHPQIVSPISREVREAFGLKSNVYGEYHPRLTKFRQEHDEEIRRNLATIETALLEIEREFKDEIQNLETVRINRYADQLLRYIGGVEERAARDTSKRSKMRGEVCPNCRKIKREIHHVGRNTARTYTCVYCRGTIAVGDADKWFTCKVKDGALPDGTVSGVDYAMFHEDCPITIPWVCQCTEQRR